MLRAVSLMARAFPSCAHNPLPEISMSPLAPDLTHVARRTGLLAALAAILLIGLAVWLVAGSRSGVIFDAASEYGRVRVVEHADGLRTLHTGAGRARQSAIHPGRPGHLVSDYTRVAMVGLALAPRDGRLLFVGLGGGAMPMYARHVLPRAHNDAVEIDPLIVAVAGRYFGFREDVGMRVHTGDGRAFIEDAAPQSWDVIFLDAFSDDEIPLALTTREFLESVRRALAADGVVIGNLWTANPAHASMVATYAAVFDQVHFVRVAGRRQTILLAGTADRALDGAALTAAARSLAAEVALGFDLPGIVARDYEPAPTLLRAPVLKDAGIGYAPRP
jgi:spermidine synthase